MNDLAARSFHSCATMVAAAALALAAGCTSPLGSRESDRGAMIPPERLREIRSLNVTEFKSAPGAAALPTLPLAADTEAIPPRAPSRFEGLATVSLSLASVRAETLRNNLALRVAMLDPAIANESLRAERARFEAVVQPFVRYRDDDRPTLQTTIPNQQKVLTGGVGVDVPLRTGGRASVDFISTKTDSPSSVLAGNQLFSSDLSFSLSQPLLRNAGEGVATSSIMIAGYGQQSAEAGTKLAVIAQLATAERQYWLVYAARRELDVRQQQYEVALEQLRQTERRFKSGDVPEVEVTRAQSGFAERLEGIIIAENAVLRAQRALKRVMNSPDLDVESTPLLVPETDAAPAPIELNSATLIEIALKERMELVQAELAILSDAVNEGVARNQVLPLVNFDGSYSFASLGTMFRENLGELPRTRFESFSVGLSAEIPLGNEGAEARLTRAILTRLQRIAGRHEQEQFIRQEVLDAADRIRAGWQRILASRQASVLAGRTLEAERRQFAQGVRTSTDVLDAAARLADAQSAEIRALADYQISQVDLAVATGTVLGAASVAFEPPDAGAANGLAPHHLPGSPPWPDRPLLPGERDQ
ncbi:MAG: TolC family protein [Phycisphaerales bacterium]